MRDICLPKLPEGWRPPFTILQDGPTRWSIYGCTAGGQSDAVRVVAEVHRAEAEFLCDLLQFVYTTPTLEARVRVLTLKSETSLANNLCPDHRDKQKGKPCLACTIEELEGKLRRDTVG